MSPAVLNFLKLMVVGCLIYCPKPPDTDGDYITSCPGSPEVGANLSPMALNLPRVFVAHGVEPTGLYDPCNMSSTCPKPSEFGGDYIY